MVTFRSNRIRAGEPNRTCFFTVEVLRECVVVSWAGAATVVTGSFRFILCFLDMLPVLVEQALFRPAVQGVFKNSDGFVWMVAGDLVITGCQANL